MKSMGELWKRLFQKREDLVFADSTKTEEIRDQIDLFLKAILPEEDAQHVKDSFISDESSVWDFWMEDGQLLLQRCEAFYGVSVSLEESHLPMYQLVDLLARRKEREAER